MHAILPRLCKTAAVASLGCAALLTSVPARSEIRLSNVAGASYSVRVMSWWEIPFRSVTRQQYDFSCGSAAVATLLTYHYGRATPEQQVFAAMWQHGNQEAIRKLGFSMLDMKEYLDGLGYKTQGFRLSMDKFRRTERPGIVLLDLNGYKHFVVVKGIRGDRVLVGDPTLGLGQYPLDKFETLWNGIFLAIVSTPQQRAPSFNLASDWGPWSTAPLEDGALSIPISRVTNEVGMDYQITPDMILDLRSLAN